MWKCSRNAYLERKLQCFAIISILVLSSIALLPNNFPILKAAAAPATSFDLYGYEAGATGGGTPKSGWTKGNLGDKWKENYWVPYKLVISNVQTNYPGLVGLPDIGISFDFQDTGSVLVDLYRDLQVRGTDFSDDENWPAFGGGGYPRTLVGFVQGQTDPPERLFASSIDLPNLNPEINVNLDGSTDSPPGQARHKIVIKRTDLVTAGFATAPTIAIYVQAHLASTVVWSASNEDSYNAPPTDAWGGYLYGINGWPSAAALDGSSFYPGSSGHAHKEGGGSADVPIPIPPNDPCEIVSCNDGNACTTDTCNVVQGQAVCSNVDTVTPTCGDGNACTTDTCNTTTGLCVNTDTVTPTCNDNDTCTDDTCNTTTGACVNTDNGSCNLEACSPGFWKNHLPPSSAWPNSGLSPSDTLTIAGFVNANGPVSMGDSLINALNYQGGPGLAGGERILVRACVSALLSASNANIDYPFTPAEVLSACNTALANNSRSADTTLAETYNGLYNTLVCPLNGKEPLIP